jgi:hypothetical protein
LIVCVASLGDEEEEKNHLEKQSGRCKGLGGDICSEFQAH